MQQFFNGFVLPCICFALLMIGAVMLGSYMNSTVKKEMESYHCPDGYEVTLIHGSPRCLISAKKK